MFSSNAITILRNHLASESGGMLVDSPTTRNDRLLFGPLAATIFTLVQLVLALLVPDYSDVHQTVSEIGEMVPPTRVAFASMLCCLAVCLLIFAPAVPDLSIAARRSTPAA
jgi:hypothetical protein